jgi:hypothetical protein
MRTLAAIGAAAVAAAVFAGTSAAAPPRTINIGNCTIGHGGQFTVPADTTVNFQFPWIARTVGLDNLFENTLDLNVSVDGAPVADPVSFWGAPYPTITIFTPPTGFEVDWFYPTGITLQSGDSVTIVWNGVLTHPITDGFQPTGGGGLVSGDPLGGQDSCTVAGEPSDG